MISKTYHITCDKCKGSVDSLKNEIPKEWKVIKISHVKGRVLICDKCYNALFSWLPVVKFTDPVPVLASDEQ